MMIDETQTKELLRVLRAIDAEKNAAKEDAHEHKERIDTLLDEALAIRHQLEGTEQAGLFEEPAAGPEAERMTALDDTPAVDSDTLGDRAYEAGAQARLDGKPESDCPHEPDTYLGHSWINGWREFQDLDTEPEEGTAEL